MSKQLQDWWGNPALDHGVGRELENKYPDKILVTVCNRPFGDRYLLFLCEQSEEEKAEEYANRYERLMDQRGITAYGLGVNLGSKLAAERLNGFQGGAEL